MQYWGLRAGCLFSPSTSSFRLIPAMKAMDCENVTVVLRCYFGRRHLQSLNLCYHQNCHVMCNQQMLFKVPGFSCYTLYCSGLNLYTYLTWSRCRLSPFSTLPLQRTVESPGCYQSFCYTAVFNPFLRIPHCGQVICLFELWYLWVKNCEVTKPLNWSFFDNFK